MSIVFGCLSLLAAWTSRLIVSFQPPIPLPLNLDLGLDLKVLGFTLLLSVLTGVICGLGAYGYTAAMQAAARMLDAIPDTFPPPVRIGPV